MKHVKIYYIREIEEGSLLILCNQRDEQTQEVKQTKLKVKQTEFPLEVKVGDWVDVYVDEKGKEHLHINPTTKDIFETTFKFNEAVREIDDKERFEFEVFAMENAIFIPVDFKLAAKHNPEETIVFTADDEKVFSQLVRDYVEKNNVKPESLPDNFLDRLYKALDPKLAAQMEYRHGCYNALTLQTLKEIEKEKGIKTFKHISFEQMEGIYVTGTMDKSCLKQNINPPRGIKYASASQMAGVAERLQDFRNEYIECCRLPDITV